MPVSVRFSDNPKGVIREDHGVVTAGEILRFGAQLVDSGLLYADAKYLIIDLSQAETLEIGPDDLKAMANTDRRLVAMNPNLSVALVAPSDALFGISRMWQDSVDQSSWNVQVFRRRDWAEAWLQTVVPGFRPSTRS